MTDAFASNAVLNTLGLTLLHFLWQGLVIGLITALVLTMMRRQTATARYVVACAGLVAMVAAPLVTWQALTESAIAREGVQAPVVAGASLAGTSALVHPASTWTATNLESVVAFVAMAWMTGVLLLTFRLIRVWVAVEGLRRRTLRPLPPVWQARIAVLANRIGIARHLRTAESLVLDVPTVVGWLRPVILVPASALAALPPSQLEAILAHELAHIRRHDYLVNLAQRVVETLLFYHPAVWWVSRQITLERELCCDDIAVDICGDRVAYAHALASLEQLRPAMPELALAATGGPLVVRIRRLINGTHPDADRSPVWTAAAVVLTLGILFVASGHVTGAETPAMPSVIVRADLPLSIPTAPLEKQVERREQSAVVVPVSQATRQQPQTPAPLPPPATTPEVPPAPSSPVVQSSYVIGPDDILRVEVLEDPKISGEVVVLPDGNVALPLLNSVRAAGLTLDEFRAAVSSAASKFVVGTPTVLIQLRESNSRRVYVGGEVMKPGVYRLPIRLTVMQLIILAGGMTAFADKNEPVVVLRIANGKNTAFKINLAELMKGISLSHDLELVSGDTVVVP